ncbi:hypothetical protein A9Q83_10295 [Alphaproteobacteria bacterium 46_93_T64]|nr:hypothetical protein A9Q83_10295 [Alphaproteobacteria bacterium 46_93_T64]
MNAFAQLNSRQAAHLKLIPRTAQQIVLVGTEAAHIGQAFKHLAPNCEQVRFPNMKRFKQHMETNPGVFAEMDAVIWVGQTYQRADLKTDLECLKTVLSENGVIILEILNPFYFGRLDDKVGAGVSYPEELIKGLFYKAKAYSQGLRTEIQDAGWRIEHIFRDNTGGFGEWLNTRKREHPSLSEILDQLDPVTKSQRFVFLLNEKSVPQLRIQAQVLKPIGGVNDVRITEPLAALSSIPGVLTDIRRVQTVVQGHLNLNKIFLWHRPVLTFEKSLSQIQSLRRAGYLIITEFDDHHSPWPEIAQNSFLSFAGVHAVQTTTPALGKMFEKLNSEVAVFPNQLSFLPDRDLSHPSEICRIFFGALNRQSDWQPILPEVNKILSSIKGNFWFDVVMDKNFFDALETNRKSFIPQCGYEDYKSHILNADISLMPLLDTEFNRMKSDLKLVEAAGHGAVPLASSVVYRQADPEEIFSKFCETPEQYAIGLKDLIEDKPRRLKMQNKGREYVRNSRLISDHVQDRYNWLLGLSERREELDQALSKRLKSILPR